MASGGERTRRLPWLILPIVMMTAGPSSAGEPIEPRPCVFVLHGLARGAASMSTLAEALDGAGFHAVLVSYRSMSDDFDGMVATLADSVAAEGEACPQTHFVGHSLGSLVIRGYLAGARPVNLGRVVMIAPPNGGSEIVDAIGGTWVFAAVFGAVATELGTSEQSLPRRLPAPDYPVGIIAGDRVINLVGWMVIPGTHDGTVSLDSTRLQGMTDFLRVPRTHTFIMRAPEVIEATVAFLRHGRFAPPASPARE